MAQLVSISSTSATAQRLRRRMSFFSSKKKGGYAGVEGEGQGLMQATPAAAQAAFMVKPVDANFALKSVRARVEAWGTFPLEHRPCS